MMAHSTTLFDMYIDPELVLEATPADKRGCRVGAQIVVLSGCGGFPQYALALPPGARSCALELENTRRVGRGGACLQLSSATKKR